MENLTDPREFDGAAVPRAGAAWSRPDRVILVYSGDSGLKAMLLNVLKKAAGREECALCEITYGPLGKHREWRECEARLGISIQELHRDQVPAEWEISPTGVPCILARVQEERPFTVLTRAQIETCVGSVVELERRLTFALAGLGAGRWA